jgi:signal transduction histidine kinase
MEADLVSRITEGAIHSRILQIDIALQDIAKEAGAHSLGRLDELKETIRNFRGYLNDFEGLYINVFNSKGDLVFTTFDRADGSAPLNYADRQWFKELKANSDDRLVISEPIKGRIQNKWLFTAARRITGKNGSFLGAVTASSPATLLLNSSVINDNHDSSAIAVASGNPLLLLARLPQSENMLGKELPPDAIAALAGDGHYSGISRFDGVERIYTVRRVSNLSMALIVGRNWNQYFLPWRSETASTAALLLGLLGFLYWILNRYLAIQKSREEELKSRAVSSRLVGLGELAGNVAHEINTPLASLLMCGERIETVLGSGNIKEADVIEVREYAGMIVDTVARVSKIVSSLRTLSRDGSGDVLESTDLAGVVGQALVLCADKIRIKGIELKTDLPASFVSCKPVEIGQVIVNLLNNSIDAVSAQKSPWIQISISENEDRVECRVTDSGPGIPSHMVKTIFEPFFTTKSAGKGTGLGLSISRTIVESQNGTLAIDETSAQTCFVFSLPKSNTQSRAL